MNTTPSSARSNALWSGAASVAGPAAQLLAAPYLIRTLGKEAYSVLLLVNSVISMSGLTTFGLSDATIKFVAEFAAEGRKDAIIGLLRTTLFLYLVLGAITAVGLSLASHFLATWLFNVGPDLIEPAALAIRIGACAFAVRLAYSVGGALCRGLRRYDLESRTGVATSLGVPGLSCLLVYQGYGFTAVILANLAVVTVTTCVLGVLGSRVLGTSRWLIPACGWEDVKRLLSYGMFSWLQMLEYVLCSQADRFIISARLGAEAVAPYAIIVQVTQLASGVVAQAFSYLFPTATEYHVKQRWADLNRLFLSGMLLTSIASLAIAALLFVYGQTVLFLWMGNSLGDYDRNLMLVLASSAALMGTTITPFYLLNGAGFVRLNTVFTMSSM
ncbi:MAG TPA: oligosaccharide flippase family protein, partial [Candidatus Limnocylindria bacterium]|nr:oligosaccharide flippase family protein [Candidatus Limnocylindria bacterium]